MVEILLQDFRYAIKALQKHPLVAAIAIGTLALGIGANTAIFSVVDAILLRPLPYRDPGRLVELYEKSESGEETNVSLPNFLDWQDQNGVFEQMAAYRWQAFNLTNVEEPELLDGLYVSSSFFPLLGVDPVLGRTFLPDEDKPGANPVVVVSHRLWQRRFGADPNLIGQTLTINRQTYSVVGITPSNFRLYEQTDLWMPVGLWAYDMMYRDFRSANVIARLKPGIAIEQARANMNAIGRQLEQRYPRSNTGAGVSVVFLHDEMVKDARTALLVLFGAVGFVLLLACANVTNLLLARAAARHKEMAIRTALGASRLRIIRQLLTENLLLAIAGGAFGLLLAFLGVHFLIAILPGNMPRIEGVGIDFRVLCFTLSTSILTGVIFGLAPALQSSKINLTEALNQGGRVATPGKERNRLRGFLVITEVAIALVLLVGAGLMIRSFIRVRGADPGFNAKSVLMMNLSLPIANYPTHDKRIAFYQQMLNRVAALPGVQAAGAACPPALAGGGYSTSIAVDGSLHIPGTGASTEYSLISYDYFRVLSIPLLKGRYFTDRDVEGTPLVAVIDDKLEHRLFGPDENPIGKRIKVEYLADVNANDLWLTIVGVVKHVKNYSIDSDSKIEMYVPYVQAPLLKFALMVRTSSDPRALVDAVRREVLQVDKGQPAYNIRTMEQDVDQAIAPQRLNTLLLGIFAGLALLMAGAGIYAVIAYSVSQRTREIGIRMALGAQKRDVLNLVIREGMLLTLLGVAIGLPLAFALTRVMSSLLYDMSATDPLTYASIPLLLAAVALTACYIPACKATKVDPIVALRNE